MSRLKLPDRLTWAVGLAQTIGLSGGSTSGWLTDALFKTHRFDIEQASRVVALETAATGIVLLIVAPIIHKVQQRLTMACAVMLIVAAQLISTQVTMIESLMVVRLFSGVGFGLVYALSAVAGTRSAEPDRTFAAAGSIQLVICTGLNPLMGYATARMGPDGLFLALAGWCFILALPLLAIMPSDRALTSMKAVETAKAAVEGVPVFAAVSIIGFVGVLLVMSLVSAANGGVYNFMATIPETFGLRGEELGVGLSFVSFLSSIGGIVANRLGTLFGRAIPLAGGLVAFGLSAFAMMNVHDRATYYVTFTFMIASFYFLSPYVFGLSAIVDPKGRLSSATGGFYMLVGSGAAWGGALVMTQFGYAAVGWTALGLCVTAAVVAVALVAFVTRRAVRLAGLSSV